ncbi:hypothetical protein MYP_3510 [Sporocytophaga myxococcoides]|uniref:Acetoacetate decarboxylase n=1 Tax=Sporocytophaga myxococcoides TaxID=153721 RepID=A0A098LH27_9BACT|nr:DUF2071 domain-containing protein [Sporocytophaga myxococcoides]GAL86281.1 hypothetical protein MYP_3510 [Sporocytophaga myxococcoides]
MLSLKNHPFAVETFFESSLVLTYAVPKEQLQSLIPLCLELDTFDDKWGFVAVALVQTKDLRPKGTPKFMGNDFFLAGFRIFVKFHNNRGKRLRGLYILKSETNKRKMSFIGNIFTHYNYSTTDITIKSTKEAFSVSSVKSALDIEVSLCENAPLPQGSPFNNWKEARRYAGPLPFTFTYNAAASEVLIIEGVRESWIPKPVEMIKAKVGFLNQMNFEGVQLANAFLIQNIPYYWKKGVIEKWTAQ